MLPITLIVTTRNEEMNIEKCLVSARDVMDQIFVIDSESDDKTVAIAERYATVSNLAYNHTKIIPWIFQWGLDNLPIRNEWVMILEADQELTPALKQELTDIFREPNIAAHGFYIRRQQVFRGQRLRFGGYGSKYMLKLFRRSSSRLDIEESDTRVYVDGPVEKLSSSIIEHNKKEDDILFYLQKHLRYAEVFAQEEARRRHNGIQWEANPRLFGSPDQRILWLKRLYFRLPLYFRAFAYFGFRYFVLLGILDGKQGTIFHFLQAFWFRLIVDIRLEEILRSSTSDSTTAANAVTRVPAA